MSKVSITVVGGAYGEECAFPPRQIFRGSGGRASAILSNLGAGVTFSTLTGPQLSAEFNRIAKNIGYHLDARSRVEDIWFRYRHPLGHPTIYPPSFAPADQQHSLTSDLALVFGMIEGRPVVHARRAVYDPQDGRKSKPFVGNGSTAKELAMVVSYSEGVALTGEKSPHDMAATLLSDQFVQAVVIKCGPQGAFVKTRAQEGWVRAFPSKRVYKIGSGDVFSAAFAYSWLIKNQDALRAAWFASRVVSAYVETALDKFNPEEIAVFEQDAAGAYAKYGASGPRDISDAQIYLAGPFFTTAQQWVVDEVRGALMDMGFNVFSPSHDVGFGPPEQVAPADLFELEKSGLVLALLDGLDSGTVFEVGYARAKGIPVVAIAEAVDANDLTMILGSGCEVSNDLTTGIYSACWHLMGDV